MTATGLDVFDKTLQVTNIWLDEIMGELGPDRHFAWHALGAVLRPLRARPAKVQDVTRAIFRTLSRHADPGQVAKVLDVLPEEIRAFWLGALEIAANDAAARAVRERQQGGSEA
jgi:uncharacterized protein (DUF2267 family)